MIKARPWLGAALALPVAVAGAMLLLWAWRAGVPWFERHVLPNYCATSPADLRLVSIARTAAAIAGAMVLLVVTPLLARWGSRRSRRDVAVQLVIVMAAVALACVAAEPLLRWREAEEKKNIDLLTPILPRFRSDARTAWAYEPNHTREVTIGGRTLTYALDADGNRARSVSDTPDPSRPTIIISGESVGFGHGLLYEETFAALLERETGMQVVNLSVVGYGTDQSYLRLMDHLPRFERPVAVVSLFVPLQIGRVRALDHPRLELREGGALEIEPAPHPLRISRLWSDEPYHGKEQLEVSRAILRATDAGVRARGARPLFVVITPSGCLPGEGLSMPWVVSELFEREKLPYVLVETGPGDSISPTDIHPNARVARRIATAVETALQLSPK